MSYPIEHIEGLSDRLTVGLERAGIFTTRHLLERAARASERASLARTVGAPAEEIERAVQIADLLRTKGVAKRYASLLHIAGVRSVQELRRRDPEQLYTHLRDTKASRNLNHRLPTPENVRDWVSDARQLQDAVK